MTAAIHPAIFLIALIALIALYALAIYLSARKAPLEPDEPELRRPPLRIVGTTDALNDPDRYQARQRWPWNVTPEQHNARLDALDELERDR